MNPLIDDTRYMNSNHLKGTALVDDLGPDYTVETLYLARDITATLVSLPANPDVPTRGAMLYLHGFIDYFFHDHVARHFADQGWSWYALDLRRNGRSLRPGQEPWYVGELSEYYEEIDLSMQRIRDDGHTNIVLIGHSTGGLTAAMWAHDRGAARSISALVLNSPWLDLQMPWFMRTIGTWAVRAVAKIRPLANIPQAFVGVYPESLNRTAKGEWEFNTRWKPLTSQAVKYGFLATVRAHHARLHRGIDVGVPVLMLRSDKSLLGLTAWDDGARSADIVLNVDQMEEWLPKIGTDVTDAPLKGAMHDVFLSEQSVREKALTTIDEWLARRS